MPRTSRQDYRLCYLSLIGAVLLTLLVGWGQPIARAAWTPTDGEDATLVLGQPDFTTNTTATSQSGMNHPRGVAVDPTTGTLFVADSDNNRVLRFASLAALQNGAAAEGVLGQPDFTSNIAATSQSGMSFPEGIAADSSGTLWVTDEYNSRVLHFDHAASKANGANADGVLGQPDFTSNAGGSSQKGMGGPRGVAVDTSGTLWVADLGNDRVLRFDHAASKANGAPADGVLGQPDFTSYGDGHDQYGVADPYSVAVDGNGTLWVADQYNNRVLRFDAAASKANGAAADGVLGQTSFTSSDYGTTQSVLFLPSGVAVDGTGTLWIADTGHQRVLRFDQAASKANGAPADGVLGQPIFTSDEPATTENGMLLPIGVAVDSAGTLWVADTYNNRVLHFGPPTATPTSTPTTTATATPTPIPADWTPVDGEPATLVLGQPDFTTTISATTQIGMRAPFSVAIDPISSKVFVADGDNNRVLRFASLAALQNGAAAEGVLGQPDFTSNTPATTQNSMASPLALGVDSSGTLWVADTYNSRVLRFDQAASKANGAPADGVLGQPDYTSATRAASRSGMFSPLGVAIDANGTLWVADFNNRVLRFNDAAHKANGANANSVLGQTTFTTKISGTGQRGMTAPYGLAVDASGTLWVADLGNNRVLRFDHAASKINDAPADGVLGQTDFTTNTGTLSQNGMNVPPGVAVDASGTLWVADLGNNRVLRFDQAASKANGAPADGVLGQPDFTTKASNTSQSGMNNPAGVAVDGAGTLWVADVRNNRVLHFGPILVPTAAPTSTASPTATITATPVAATPRPTKRSLFLPLLLRL